MNLKGMLSTFADQYDKLIAGLVVLLLLVSAVYLGIRLRGVSRDEARTKDKLEQMTPAHPHAAASDLSMYDVAKQKVAEPDQVGVWSNALFVPETRVWCVGCRWPIEITAEICPFCKTVQPKPPKEPDDFDQDGMLDKWEIEHGLNPADPTDAAKDPDGDGFTNIEEFNAVPSTDPQDLNDHPPIVGKLCVDKIVANPFRLLFKSILTMPDGSPKFAINDQNTNKTWFKKMGEDVEGFVLYEFEEHFEEETSGGITRQVNRSVLTLKRGKKPIPLTMGKRVSYVELTTVLTFRPDGSTYTLKAGEEMELRGKHYKVLRIDSEGGTVVLGRLSDGKRLVITPCRARDS